jgi:hypothetical protein
MVNFAFASLRDRHVVVIPDFDSTGNEHAIEVATKLQKVTSSLKILRLPWLSPKGDVSEWLDRGHSAKQLQDHSAETPEWIYSPPILVPRLAGSTLRENATMRAGIIASHFSIAESCCSTFSLTVRARPHRR